MNSGVNKVNLSNLEGKTNSSYAERVFDFFRRNKKRVAIPITLAVVSSLAAVGGLYNLRPISAETSKTAMMQSFEGAYTSDKPRKPQGVIINLEGEPAKTLLKEDKNFNFFVGGAYTGNNTKKELFTALTDGRPDNGELRGIYTGRDNAGNFFAVEAEFPNKDSKSSTYVTGFNYEPNELSGKITHEALDDIVSNEKLQGSLFVKGAEIKDAKEYISLDKGLYNLLRGGLSDSTGTISDYFFSKGLTNDFEIYRKEVDDAEKASINSENRKKPEYFLKVNLSKDSEKPDYKFVKINPKDYALLESVKNKKDELDKRFSKGEIKISWEEAREVIQNEEYLSRILKDLTHVATLEGVKNGARTGYAGFYTNKDNEDLYTAILTAYVNGVLSTKVIGEFEVTLPNGKKEIDTVRDFEFAGNPETKGLNCSQGCYYGKNNPAIVFKDGKDGYNCNGTRYPNLELHIIMKSSKTGRITEQKSPHLFFLKKQNAENYSYFMNLKKIFYKGILESEIGKMAKQRHMYNLTHMPENNANIIITPTKTDGNPESTTASGVIPGDNSGNPGSNTYNIGGV